MNFNAVQQIQSTLGCIHSASASCCCAFDSTRNETELYFDTMCLSNHRDWADY